MVYNYRKLGKKNSNHPVQKMKKNSIILDNKMELIRWGHNVMPIIVYCHPKRTYQYVYSHWHKELEISCLFEGEVEFYHGGIGHIVKGCGINIANPKEMHYAIPRKMPHKTQRGVVGITVLIDDSFLRSLIPDLDGISFAIQSKEVEDELAEKMEFIYELYCQSENLETKIRIFAAVCELIAILYEKCKIDKMVIPSKEQKYRERMERIIEYLNEHYKEKLSQQELAGKFHFSREYFSKFFKKQTGITFKQYITRYRLEKAKDELLRADHSVLDIALNNGFSSETQFISSFKNIYGLTPLRYRKSYGQEKERPQNQ